MKNLTLYIVLALALALPSGRADFNYTVNFDSDELDPNFYLRLVGPDLATPPAIGYSIVAEDGVLKISKAAGAGNGSASFNSTFLLVGNFEAEVRSSRPTLGTAEAGLLGSSTFGFFDAFFSSMDSINSVIVMEGAPTQSIGTGSSAVNATFRL